MALLVALLPEVCSAGPPPVLTGQPVSQTVLLNDSVTFTVSASSGTTLSFQWLLNGSNIAGATLSTYTIAHAQSADQGNYAARVANTGGSVATTNAALTVLTPPFITTAPQSQTLTQGQTVTLWVGASGTAPLGYQWSFNQTPIVGGTGSAYTCTNAQLANAGAYSVVVSNVAGTAYSSDAILTVATPVGVSGDIFCVSATNVSTRAWSHTVKRGDNRLLLVGIALADNSVSVTGVTYGGTPLNRVVSTQSGNTVEMWYLLAPAPGTANIVATWSANRDMASWSGTFTNVDQTGPIRNWAVTNGNTSTPTLALSSALGDLVVDTLSANGDAISLAVGPGQTQFCQNTTGIAGGNCWGASSYKPGAANVSMSWTTGAAKSWGLAAVVLKPAPALQSDVITTLSGPFAVPSGANFTYTINVTNASPTPSSNIIVSDILPSGVVLFSASSGGASNGGVITWPAFDLAGNTSTNFALIVTTPGGGMLTNTVSSTAATYDPDSSNNNGSASAATVVTLVVAQSNPAAGGSGERVCVSATNVSTRTWSHTVSGGNNRLLLVGIALADNTVSVTGVTYGGATLSRIVSTQSGNTVEMWCLLAPPPGTANIVATWSANKDMAGWSDTIINVDQTSPIRNSAVTNGNTSTPSITLSSAAGDLVVDTLSANGDAMSLSVGPGQTQICQSTTGNAGGNCWGAASYELGAASVTMSWTTSAAKNWGLAAAVLKPAPAIQADIATALTGPTVVPVSSLATYSVSVTNLGPKTANNIVITDTLPVGVTFITDSAGGVAANGVVTWTFPSLLVGATTNFTFSLTAANAGQFTNTVTAMAETSDPYPGNNSSSVATSIISTPPVLGSPVFSSSVMTPTGFKFQLSVPAGSIFVVSASTNLLDWVPIFTNLAPTTNITVNDPAAANFNARFYRAKVQ